MLTDKKIRLRCLELSLFRPVSVKDLPNNLISPSQVDDLLSTVMIAKIYFDFIKGKLDKEIAVVIEKINEKEEKKKIFTVVK